MENAPDTLMPLPSTLGLKEAAPLAKMLRDARGRPVMLDASAVQHLGTLCLQVLLSARDSWASDNLSWLIVNPSSEFSAALAEFGASSLSSQTRII